MYLDEYLSEGYYDDYGNWIVTVAAGKNIPKGHVHDSEGRLMKNASEIINYEECPEDLDIFTSKWQKPMMTMEKDWTWSTKISFPEINHVVILKRMDLYQSVLPKMQQATTDINLSRSIRNTEGWHPVRSIFFMPEPIRMTSELFIESTGPPRRHKFRPTGKQNPRDMSKWLLKETLHAYVSPDRIPGASEFHIDFCDLPDRYFISSSPDPPFGARRMYRFAAYSATQYFILERYIHHEALDAEGGYGFTYLIVPGPILFARYDWRIIGSFYGFDHQLTGTSRYTVYTRQDPFPRIIIAQDNISRPEDWTTTYSFYAYDVPVPGTCVYNVHHCLRSIHSAAASIQRHRMTSEDPRGSWDYRMKIYVFPAALEDCTFTQSLYGILPQGGAGVGTAGSAGEGVIDEEGEYLQMKDSRPK